jgi:hypothetical protein
MEGYAKVAHLMAKYDEFAILRRFKALNAQELLYSQAEIIHLEERLQRLVDRDATHPDRKFYSKDWWSLAHGLDIDSREQWRTIRKIRKKLDKYSKETQTARFSAMFTSTRQMSAFSGRPCSPNSRARISSTSNS